MLSVEPPFYRKIPIKFAHLATFTVHTCILIECRNMQLMLSLAGLASMHYRRILQEL